jgi:uncharacterized protein (DUF2252 family)
LSDLRSILVTVKIRPTHIPQLKASRPQALSALPLDRWESHTRPEALPRYAGQVSPLGLRSPSLAQAHIEGLHQRLALAPEVLAQRRQLMTTCASRFLRVNPSLFWRDVEGPFRQLSRLLPNECPKMQVIGDVHLGNFGTFRGPKGQTLWGLNDYDMAGPGRPEHDLGRLAASLVLMGQEAGLERTQMRELLMSLGRAYMEGIRKSAQDHRPENQAGLSLAESKGVVRQQIEKNRARTQTELLAEFAVPDAARLKRNSKLKECSQEEVSWLKEFFAEYQAKKGTSYELLDGARRLGSGGSTFGLDRYYLLLRSGTELPILLDLKQELEPRSGNLFESMKVLGGTPDPAMAVFRQGSKTYLVREREREKSDFQPTHLKEPEWRDWVKQAGTALSRSHAHQRGAASALQNWLGSQDDKLLERLQDFAFIYARQVRADWQHYQQMHPSAS